MFVRDFCFIRYTVAQCCYRDILHPYEYVGKAGVCDVLTYECMRTMSCDVHVGYKRQEDFKSYLSALLSNGLFCSDVFSPSFVVISCGA